MTARNDHDYYRRREKTERLLAAKAEDGCVRRVHTHFANEYAKRADETAPANLMPAA